MSDNSIGNHDGADVIERVRAYVVDLGRRAVGLCELYDFGFPSSVVRDQIARLGRDFDSFRGAFEVPELASGGRGSLWDHEQSVRYAAGAAMITARFRGAMSPANVARAAAAKAIHEFQADLLDDIIDGGVYTFEEARALYRVCLGPMTEARFDADELQMELRHRIQAHQQGTVDLLTSLTTRLHELLRHAPNWDAFRSEIRRENQRLATGQALTVFQMRDYEPLLKRMAELSGRAITSAHEALDDPDTFYPFVAFMMPVVMLTEPDGSGEDLLHAYLRALAPAIRDACRATMPAWATTPRGTRSGRPYSARIASSLLCP